MHPQSGYRQPQPGSLPSPQWTCTENRPLGCQPQRLVAGRQCSAPSDPPATQGGPPPPPRLPLYPHDGQAPRSSPPSPQPPLFWEMALGSLDVRSSHGVTPAAFTPQRLTRTTQSPSHRRTSVRSSFTPSGWPRCSLTSPCSSPTLPPSQRRKLPFPHPAITVPMRYSSNRQKVLRFCGAILPLCLCRCQSHTLFTASSAAGLAGQLFWPSEAASRRGSPT
jgi:hypothetical protein